MRCSECGGQLIRDSLGFLVCQNCGLVYDDYTEYLLKEPRNRRDEPQFRSNLTEVGRDVEYLKRKYSKILTPSDLAEVNRILLQIQSFFNLPENVVSDALKLYQSAQKQNLNTTKYKLLATCVLLALRRNGVYSYRAIDIVNFFRKQGHRVHFNDISKLFVELRKTLGIEIKDIDHKSEVVKLINKLYHNAEIKRKTNTKLSDVEKMVVVQEIKEEAIRILEKLPRKIWQGTKRTAIYVIVTKLAEDRVRVRHNLKRIYSLKELCLKFNISEKYTERKLKEIRKIVSN